MAAKVSVLMSVYNGERYLREAVESILNQTFTDFEFIIIEDGSTDATPRILRSYSDSRIVLVDNQENLGLTRSLNEGLVLAQGEYVARMDADDISLPHRLEKQVAFLERHPKVGIVGSACQVVDASGRRQGLNHAPTRDLQIRWVSLLNNPFWHPTVIMRRDVLLRNGLSYDEAFQTAQDYDLWTRMLKCTYGANLIEPLVRYRLCDGITITHREAQLRNHDTIALRTIQEELPGFAITFEQVGQLRALFVGGSEFTPGFNRQIAAPVQLYLDMFETFKEQHPGEHDLEELQRQEAVGVAGLVLRSPLQSGWIRIAERLVAMDPSLSLLNVVGRRLVRCMLDFLHHSSAA